MMHLVSRGVVAWSMAVSEHLRQLRVSLLEQRDSFSHKTPYQSLY